MEVLFPVFKGISLLFSSVSCTSKVSGGQGLKDKPTSGSISEVSRLSECGTAGCSLKETQKSIKSHTHVPTEEPEVPQGALETTMVHGKLMSRLV